MRRIIGLLPVLGLWLVLFLAAVALVELVRPSRSPDECLRPDSNIDYSRCAGRR